MKMKTLYVVLLVVLLTGIAANDGNADDDRPSTRGGKLTREVLRLKPGIAKDPNRYVDRTKEGVMESLGGSDETEAAVRRALDWFTKQQKDDGHWEETSSPIAHTGLVMLCYYSFGASHNKEGPYQETLAKALEWMIKQVGPKGQLMDGGRGYDHSIGTLALAEAYGASGDEEIKGPLEKAIKYLVNWQNTDNGGWRYIPRSEKSDLSVSGWAVMALASAELSGIVTPQKTKAKALEFLDRVGTGRTKGMYGYAHPVPKKAMTAVGMYVLELLVSPKNSKRLDESVQHLMTHMPDKEDKNFYYWYYGTLSLRLYGGEGWEEWNSRMAPLLLELQSADGSWAPNGQWGKRAGGVITTAWATLCLEVYYRYTPLGKINPKIMRGRSLSSPSNSENQASPFSRSSTRPNSGRPQ
jgi:hypothetical protein